MSCPVEMLLWTFVVRLGQLIIQASSRIREPNRKPVLIRMNAPSRDVDKYINQFE